MMKKRRAVGAEGSGGPCPSIFWQTSQPYLNKGRQIMPITLPLAPPPLRILNLPMVLKSQCTQAFYSSLHRNNTNKTKKKLIQDRE